ncbi:MAG: FkbM family methyltransferase [Verrucomicrobiota bacterium]
MKKIRSLLKYICLFSNWWIAASARYLRHHLGKKQVLYHRNGSRITFRPGSDYIALGEVFCIENYSPCLDAKKPLNVWDIGGNIGSFVLWHSSKMGEVSYHSFEPCEDTFKVLLENQQSNPSISWKVYPYGLSNKNEECEAYVPNDMYGQTSKYSAKGKKVILPLRSINDVWSEFGKPKIDLLKIDCEGGEYAIFKGCSAEFLEKVEYIIMEVHIIDEYNPRSITEKLGSAGFIIVENIQEQGVIWAKRGTRNPQQY